MKKNMFLKLIVSLVMGNLCFMTSQAKFSLWDFVKGVSSNSSIPNEESPKKATTSRPLKSSYVEPVMDAIEEPVQEIISEKIETLPSPIDMQEQVPAPISAQDNYKKNIELEIIPSVKISSVEELLKVINSNVEKLSRGRISTHDHTKLDRQKDIIASLQSAFNLKYDICKKIYNMEKILVSYNLICEIPAYFLEDIDKSVIEKVHNSMFLTNMEAAQSDLTQVFGVEVTSEIKDVIKDWTEKTDRQSISAFLDWVTNQLHKIPLELLDSKEKDLVKSTIAKANKSLPVDFKERCYALRNIVKSFNAIKAIPFRLMKIETKTIKAVILQMVEREFFDKMLSELDIMAEAHFSENAISDEEVLAARNIKKTRSIILGGGSVPGKISVGNLEIFQTAQSSYEKFDALKEAVNQFNKTVNMYKKAMDITQKKSADIVNPIHEDIERILEKVRAYEVPTKKETQALPQALSEPNGQVDIELPEVTVQNHELIPEAGLDDNTDNSVFPEDSSSLAIPPVSNNPNNADITENTSDIDNFNNKNISNILPKDAFDEHVFDKPLEPDNKI